MATWAEFANAEPDLAAFARERMEGRIVYQATLRLDGGPRVHPVSPWVGAGLLCVSFRDTSPKSREVARDARYALHTALPGIRERLGFGGEDVEEPVPLYSIDLPDPRISPPDSLAEILSAERHDRVSHRGVTRTLRSDDVRVTRIEREHRVPIPPVWNRCLPLDPDSPHDVLLLST